MRHRKTGRKLGTDASHTKAMKKSLVSALFLNDRIKTVEARAKEIRGDVDKIITWAKRGDLHSRRLAIAALGDKELVREIFEKVEQGMFSDRQGGYTRIVKLGNRKGDNAPVVIMELVTEAVSKQGEAAPVKAVAKKATASKTESQADTEEKTAEQIAEENAQAPEVAEVAEVAEPAEAAEAAEVAEAPAKKDPAKNAPAKTAEAKEATSTAAKKAPAKKAPAKEVEESTDATAEDAKGDKPKA